MITRQWSPPARSSDEAMSDPASANMMPIDGKTAGSHTQPNMW
jgi:hypothetical protein